MAPCGYFFGLRVDCFWAGIASGFFAMRGNLLIGVSALLFTGAVVLVAVVAKRLTQLPPETTPRLLACDPDFYAGRTIRVRTSGMEVVGNELHFRENTTRPPAVVCRGAIPNPPPALVTGLCVGKQGDVVLVVDCRP